MEIFSSRRAQLYLRQKMRLDIEEFWILALAANKRLIASDCLFRGTVDACLIHPRDIFRFVILQNASSFIIAHGHPSGEALPSIADIQRTAQIFRASRLLQIPLLDHLILTKDSYLSFREENLKPFNRRSSCREPGTF